MKAILAVTAIIISALIINLEFSNSTGKSAAIEETPGHSAVATFAGGCFWCTEADLDRGEQILCVMATIAAAQDGITS